MKFSGEAGGMRRRRVIREAPPTDEHDPSVIELLGITPEIKRRMFDLLVVFDRSLSTKTMQAKHAMHLAILFPEETAAINSKIELAGLVYIIQNLGEEMGLKAAAQLASLSPAESKKLQQLLFKYLPKWKEKFAMRSEDTSWNFITKLEQQRQMRTASGLARKEVRDKNVLQRVPVEAQALIQRQRWEELLNLGMEATLYDPALREPFHQALLEHDVAIRRELDVHKRRFKTLGADPDRVKNYTQAAAAYAVLRADAVRVSDRAQVELIQRVKPVSPVPLPLRSVL